MSDMVKELAYLCTPHAERLPDFDRINEFCRVGREAVKSLERTEAELLRLREENARYKLTYAKYVEAADRMNGTPCEQIRHQQEVEALREENARLREALTLFAAKEPVQLTYEGRAFIKAIIVSESELTAARDAIREGENRDD